MFKRKSNEKCCKNIKNKINSGEIMKVYNYIEAQQNLAAVLNTALIQDVIVEKRNGQRFKIISITEKINQSPF